MSSEAITKNLVSFSVIVVSFSYYKSSANIKPISYNDQGGLYISANKYLR